MHIHFYKGGKTLKDKETQRLYKNTFNRCTTEESLHAYDMIMIKMLDNFNNM